MAPRAPGAALSALAAVMAGRRVTGASPSTPQAATTALLTVALRSQLQARTTTIGGHAPRQGPERRGGQQQLLVAEADEDDGAYLVYRRSDRHQHQGEPPRPLGDRGGLPPCARRLRLHGRPRQVPGLLRLRPRCRRAGRAAACWWPSRRHGVHPPAPADLAPAAWPTHALGARERYLTDALAARRRREFDDQPHWPRPARRPRPRDGWTQARAGASGSTTATPPTRQIAGDLAAPRGGRPGRLVVAFQPHLVSRTRMFGAAMGVALGAADEVVVLRRLPGPGGRGPGGDRCAGRGRRTAAARAGRLRPRPRDVAAELVARARPGDLVLTLGAGDVTTVGPTSSSCWQSEPMAQRDPGRAPDAGSPGVSGAGAGWPGATSSRSCWCSRWSAGVYVVWFSSWLAVEAIEVSGAQTVYAERDPRPRGHRRGRAAGPVDLVRPSRGSGRWPWSGPPTSPGSGRTGADQRSTSERRSRSSRSAGSCAAWTRRASSSADYRRARRLPRVETVDRDHPAGAPRGRRGDLGAAGRARLLVDHVEVDDRRPDLAGAQGRPRGGVGERGGVRDQGRGAGRPARQRPGPGVRRQRPEPADHLA